MDNGDRAQEREEQFRTWALARRPVLPTGESAETCDECGQPIPEARRRLVPGVRLCFWCQSLRERHGG
jgi:phage/conjugal plasmid C-4 type zinc finger TraR family protein